MNEESSQLETLIRYLDGNCTPSEEAVVVEMLKRDASARRLLSELCEQAVSVADLTRTHAITQGKDTVRLFPSGTADVLKPNNFRKAGGKVTVFAGVAALLMIAGLSWKSVFGSQEAKPLLTISGSNSACQILTRFGQVETRLEKGRSVQIGETLESQCSDSFLKLRLGKRSGITMAGYAYLQQMEQNDSFPLFNFPHGSLWAEIEPDKDFDALRIQTTSATFEFRKAQFDLQTKRGNTRLRMNEGEAKVMRLVDQSTLTIGKGQMVEITSQADKPLLALDQPKPVLQWQFHQLKGPDILLGETRATLKPGYANIQAAPLPWRIAEHQHIMLYAAAFSVSRSSPNPVLLKDGSRIRYQFSYDKKIPVRFGFSTQRMQGVFAGKYETDVSHDMIQSEGDIYQVDLSLGRFRPLQANQPLSPEGLEINDIYALTIQEDAGLHIHWIEILPPER
jgi:hypothetical protein